jgi:hypothetical protein
MRARDRRVAPTPSPRDVECRGSVIAVSIVVVRRKPWVFGGSRSHTQNQNIEEI